jgi:hypothetical protein
MAEAIGGVAAECRLGHCKALTLEIVKGRLEVEAEGNTLKSPNCNGSGRLIGISRRSGSIENGSLESLGSGAVKADGTPKLIGYQRVET